MAAQALSAAEFANKVQKYARKTVQLIAREVTAKVFVQVANTILQTTPVLTGHARHNWIASMDEPETTEIEGVAGVAHTGDDITGDEESLITDLMAQFVATEGATTLYFSNSVPYIGALDSGSSAKAPAGIVQPSITASLALLKDTRGVG